MLSTLFLGNSRPAAELGLNKTASYILKGDSRLRGNDRKKGYGVNDGKREGVVSQFDSSMLSMILKNFSLPPSIISKASADKQMDKLVYDLYNLTEEEMGIVKGEIA